MPVTLEKSVELTVDDLIRAVAQLPPAELSDFEWRYDELRIARLRFRDSTLARIADAHRLPAADRVRVRELLTRNREADLKPEEARELDGYLSTMGRQLGAVADEILALAERRQRTPARPAHA